MNGNYGRIIIFGGTGFIGSHLADYFLRLNEETEIILVDLEPPKQRLYCPSLMKGIDAGVVQFAYCDVRNKIALNYPITSADLIINLAAVHREPGHDDDEYYETNIAGARNVCSFAAEINCPFIVFTSSIAVYGAPEYRVDEETVPQPNTPYGISKLAAETIHREWAVAGDNRTLLILRPGVVYGPGEGGNVSRLIKATLRGYFVYTGNRNTEKSGGYVRELCRSLDFCLNYQRANGLRFLLVNFSLFPPPTMADYIAAVEQVTGKRWPRLNVPLSLLIVVSKIISTIANLFGISQPINPTRVKKLVRSNRIEAQALKKIGYANTFKDVASAFSDWKNLNPRDFE